MRRLFGPFWKTICNGMFSTRLWLFDPTNEDRCQKCDKDEPQWQNHTVKMPVLCDIHCPLAAHWPTHRHDRHSQPHRWLAIDWPIHWHDLYCFLFMYLCSIVLCFLHPQTRCTQQHRNDLHWQRHSLAAHWPTDRHDVQFIQRLWNRKQKITPSFHPCSKAYCTCTFYLYDTWLTCTEPICLHCWLALYWPTQMTPSTLTTPPTWSTLAATFTHSSTVTTNIDMFILICVYKDVTWQINPIQWLSFPWISAGWLKCNH